MSQKPPCGTLTCQDDTYRLSIDDDDAQQDIEIIRWCANRDMLQQALGLYREKAASILESRGYIPRGPQAQSANNESWLNCVMQLCEDYSKPSEGHLSAFDVNKCDKAFEDTKMAAKTSSWLLMPSKARRALNSATNSKPRMLWEGRSGYKSTQNVKVRPLKKGACAFWRKDNRGEQYSTTVRIGI